MAIDYTPDSPQAQAFVAKLAQRTVQLAPRPGRYPPSLGEIPIGSGVFVRLGDKTWVATARHTFAKLPAERFLLNCCNPSLGWGMSDAEFRDSVRSGRDLPGAAVPIRYSHFPEDEDLDLALLLPNSVPRWCEPCDLDAQELADVEVGDNLFAAGMAVDSGYTETRSRSADSPARAFHAARLFSVSVAARAPGPAGGWRYGFEPERHFAIHYDPAEWPNKRVHPRGMSGCGIWKLTEKKSGIWAPQAALAGIQIEYEDQLRLMKAVRTRTLLRFWKEEVQPKA